ncbi:hypothetical protein N6H05_18925 [Sphingobium sp. WTD-1]|uniref:hypothetical protein n=1 Tax=Sphingobium sp. WTD-1 TaxID=2979467 RepID=UPI0024DE9CEA|nr:hypothetical protein [Sphingobium sp. WTD-1]WIA55089.1 hypothetical protein N6H05_18925 [Sphingobium sp. WTD-1]
MADNAIEKLIEEMRAAREAIFAAECGIADAKAAVQAAEEKHRAALKRNIILSRTMEKHIYEDMPIVQAKMQAHEEIENQVGITTTSAVWATQARTSATIAGSSAVNAVTIARRC